MDEHPDVEPTPYEETAALPYPPLPPAAPPPTAARPRRWRRGAMKALGLGAVVVLAAGTSGVVVHELDGNGTTSTPTATTRLVPAAAGVASVQSALAKAEKSVVIINDTMTSPSSNGRGGFGGFGGFGNQSYTSSAAGTGIVISADGNVVTNAHVVNGASKITVTLPDGSKKSATVVGMNTAKDLAVIKVAGVSGLTPATWADSDSAQVGDQVIAIGNAEGYGGSPSVTAGILSAKDRSLSSSDGGSSTSENLSGLLQTDAPINPGNSGGPLVDAAGDVLGIDTAVATGTADEPAQNIGFAIPSNTVVATIPSLLKGGTSGGSSNGTTASGAVLGVEVSDQSGTTGAVVEQVVPGSGAAKAGLASGDVITKVGSTSIGDAADLASAVRSHHVGDSVTITYTRDGSTHTAKATLGAADTTQG